MKHFLMAMILTATAASGQHTQAPRKDKAASKAKPAAATLPADAEKVSEGVWRVRDAQGKTWIYKRTPFGLTRYEEAAAKSAPPAQGSGGIRVREESGSKIVFERITPFGRRTWSRSPQELDAEERQALDEWRRSAEKQN